MSLPAKVARIMATVAKKIGTHNGTFHCDEVLACFMLKELPEYKDADVIRTRDQKVLMEECDIVVDVGGEYNHLMKRYDHHQLSFEHTFSTIDPSKKWKTKLSSAGLIYIHYGREVIEAIMERLRLEYPAGVHTKKAGEDLFDYVYSQLIEEIDGNDNGENQYNAVCDGKPITANYKVTTTLPRRVARLNTNWYEEDQNSQNKRFEQAMQIVGEELEYQITHYIKSNMAAYKHVVDAFKSRIDGSIMVLNKKSAGCPWKEHIFNVEKEHNAEGEVIYVVYPDIASDGDYRIQCVPTPTDIFGKRVPLAWSGHRGEDLCKESGIDGCIFVHKNGFIGGNKSLEGALKMARKSLQIEKYSNSAKN